jgi:methionyl-tRNA synthetase
MGKDNITFHTVIFPSSLIASGQPWTKLHHVSTTEFLNYELDEATKKPLKFSKTRGIGVFGDNAMESGIPSEVWRYYLLINRPESQDTIFLWDDFVAKNNNELLANLGNFSNRLLKFVASSFKGVVPAYGAETHNEQDSAFVKQLFDKFNRYNLLMEAVKLKDGLKVAMEYSSDCNAYL